MVILISEFDGQRFHFKGYFKGQRVNEVRLSCGANLFEKGEAYLLFLKEVRIKHSVLLGKLISSKRLCDG